MIFSKAYDGKEMKSFRSLWGQNYVNSRWLGDIQSINVGQNVFLKAKVSPSQPGVGRADYHAWILIASDGEDSYKIENASCTCPAGLGRGCSHISAIGYAVVMAWNQGFAGKSVTDFPVSWGKGATSSAVDHQAELKEIDFSRPNKNKPINTDNIIVRCKPQKEFRFKKLESHNELVEFSHSSCLSKIFQCKGTIINKILLSEPCQLSTSAGKTSNPKDVHHGNHELDYSNPINIADIQCQPCRDFYRKYVHLSENKIDEVCLNTTEQNSDLWFDSRKVRIPASVANKVPKTSKANPQNFVTNHLYPRFKGNNATQHGKVSEPIAKEIFEKKFDLEVKNCGTVINKDEPFLSASPDGTIDDDMLLEIKCPVKSIDELLNNKSYDICKENDTITVNKSGRNGYYTQIQMQLFCTRKSTCKYFTWFAKNGDSVCIDVQYNETFVSNILPRIRAFYFNHLLVRIVDDFSQGRFVFSEKYEKLCSTL